MNGAHNHPAHDLDPGRGRDHDHDHDGAHHDRHHAGHSHTHAHAPAHFGAAFAIGACLNAGFVVAEVVYGIFGNSVALLADAGHNLGDVLGLLAAWAASILVTRAPTARFTYGLRGSSILAALFNAVFLLIVVGAISWEAVMRFWRPEPVAGQIVMIVAAIGIVINGVTAWLFASGRENDINLRAAFLHMASDALVSAGVVIAGLIIAVSGWLWLDPLVSLIVNGVIVWGTWSILREALGMSMAAVPDRINPARVRAYLEARPGVAAIHDLHIWPMSTTEIALTCHLVMPDGYPGDPFLHEIAADLAARFKIDHPTLQIELDPHGACALASDDKV